MRGEAADLAVAQARIGKGEGVAVGGRETLVAILKTESGDLGFDLRAAVGAAVEIDVAAGVGRRRRGTGGEDGARIGLGWASATSVVVMARSLPMAIYPVFARAFMVAKRLMRRRRYSASPRISRGWLARGATPSRMTLRRSGPMRSIM